MSNSLVIDGQEIFFQTGKERSVDFALAFSERVARPFVCRLTGGCANMTATDAIGMRNLENAFRGRGSDQKTLPHFAGFALFGGTRMVSIHDPSVIVPGITEIFPAVAPECPGTVMLGIIPGFRKFQRSKDPRLAGQLILSMDNNVITAVHPDLDSVLCVQPTADREEIWDDEYRECWKYIRTLHERNWQSLLVVYNGGSVTEREILLWANWQLQEPGRWKMLIVKDSGRKATEYASNQQFLDAHPDVHVADNSVEAINAKLHELGALVERQEDGTNSDVLPFTRVA